MQHFFFGPENCYPQGTLSDVVCRGVKVASAFPGELDNVTLCCVGVEPHEVERVPHNPNRPVEAKYTEGEQPILVLPDRPKEVQADVFDCPNEDDAIDEEEYPETDELK
jgi:hypothetical protein